MEIGDKVRELITRSNAAASVSGSDQRYTGTVIYIHPQGRFYTAEFELAMGKVRESYRFAPQETPEPERRRRRG